MVEAQVSRFVPDPGYVTTTVVVREQSSGDVIVSLQRGEPSSLSCSDRADGEWTPVRVRSLDGCTLRSASIEHVEWNEAHYRWIAEAPDRGTDVLTERVNNWALISADDL